MLSAAEGKKFLWEIVDIFAATTIYTDDNNSENWLTELMVPALLIHK